MADEELRRREREAGDPQGILAAASALLRAGQPHEALTTLLDVRRDPAVRRELARFPAWTHESAGPGITRQVDALLPRRQPHVRWAVETGLEGPLLASPLGVVSGRCVLDPLDGEPLAALSAPARCWSRDELVIPTPGALRWLGPDLGEVRRELALEPGAELLAVWEELVVLALERGQRIEAVRVPSTGAPEPCWERPRQVEEPHDLPSAIVLPDGVVVVRLTGSTLTGIDLHGRSVFQRPGRWAAGDESGILTLTAGRAVTHHGAWEWELLGSAGHSLCPVALGERAALVQTGWGIEAFARRTGAHLGAIVKPCDASGGLLLARDVVVYWEGVSQRDGRTWSPGPPLIRAVTLAGETLWELGPAALDDEGPRDAAAFGRWLYVRTDHGRVVCLEG